MFGNDWKWLEDRRKFWFEMVVRMFELVFGDSNYLRAVGTWGGVGGKVGLGRGGEVRGR